MPSPTSTLITPAGVMIFREGIGYVSPGKDYWHVDLGRRDALNGTGSYAFPTEFAAFRFAACHKRRDTDRDIAVRCPDGSRVDIALPDLGDPHDHEEPQEI